MPTPILENQNMMTTTTRTPSARQFAFRAHGFNHPSGIDQSSGAKVLVPGQKTKEVFGVIHEPLATDHETGKRTSIFGHGTFSMVNIRRACTGHCGFHSFTMFLKSFHVKVGSRGLL